MMVPVSMCGYPNTFHKQISFTWPDLISSVVYSCADFTGWIQVVMCKLCSTYKNDILASLLLSHKVRAVPAVSGIHSGLTLVEITSYKTEYVGIWNNICIHLRIQLPSHFSCFAMLLFFANLWIALCDNNTGKFETRIPGTISCVVNTIMRKFHLRREIEEFSYFESTFRHDRRLAAENG